MSQVARAKKMFDDVSSESESKVSETPPVATTSSAAPQLNNNNNNTAAGSSGENGGDSNAFVPKSASASQARAETAAAGDEQEEAEVELPASGNDAGQTMVTRVEVSPPPREAPASKPPAPASSTTARALAVSSTATPKKTGGKSTTAAAAPSSSLSTPATVSKRPVEREEREAAAAAATGGGGDSAVRKGKKSEASVTKASRYQERDDAAAFSTVANRGDSRTSRRQHGESREMDEAAVPYSAKSGRSATAAQLDYSREEDRHHHHHDEESGGGGDRAALLRPAATDDDSEVEDFPFSTYVFPRLDPALADYQGSRTAVGAAKRGEECPPNACERCLAYLMVTDIRVAVYLGVLFLCTIFVIVSIPTSQLDMVGKSCLTYWGSKNDCDSATYTLTRQLIPCSAIRSRLGAGAAFSIITLVIYLVNLTATMIAICCLKTSPHKISLTSRIVVGTVGGVIVVTQLISWAVIAGIHSAHYCYEAGVLAFGVGFGLNLTAWILNFLGVVLVVAIPSRVVNRG